MTSNGFQPNKQVSDWLTYLVYKLEACFFDGNHFLARISEKIDFIQDLASKWYETIALTISTYFGIYHILMKIILSILSFNL